MRIETTAFVLHKRPFKSSSVLLDIFSEEQGYLRVLMRGGAKAHQKHAVFSKVWLNYKDSDNLPTLYQAESLKSVFLKDTALLCGLYANELLIKLLSPKEPMPALFLSYQHLIERLIKPKAQLAIALRLFEHDLIACLGYGFCYQQTADSGQAIISTNHYHFVQDLGFVLAKEPLKYVNYSKLTIKGDVLLNISKRDFSQPETQKVAKALFKWRLDSLLEGKSLVTRDILMGSQNEKSTTIRG